MKPIAQTSGHRIERFGAINLVASVAGITKDGLMLTVNRDGKVAGKMSRENFQKVIDINLTAVISDCS